MWRHTRNERRSSLYGTLVSQERWKTYLQVNLKKYNMEWLWLQFFKTIWQGERVIRLVYAVLDISIKTLYCYHITSWRHNNQVNQKVNQLHCQFHPGCCCLLLLLLNVFVLLCHGWISRSGCLSIQTSRTFVHCEIYTYIIPLWHKIYNSIKQNLYTRTYIFMHEYIWWNRFDN